MNEEEVDEQVSTLKQTKTGQLPQNKAEPHELGFRNASFVWNAVLEEESQGKVKTSDDPTKTNPNHTRERTDDSLVTIDVESASTSDSAGAENSTAERKFELRELNIVFPQGELTVVTGPTASGKTALLVRKLSLAYL